MYVHHGVHHIRLLVGKGRGNNTVHLCIPCHYKYVRMYCMCSIVEVLMAIRCTVCGPGVRFPGENCFFRVYKEVSAAILDCLTMLVPENGRARLGRQPWTIN